MMVKNSNEKMHKYTVDLLNTLDEYRLQNITYSHKDPYIKEKVMEKHVYPFNTLNLIIFFMSMLISNIILLISSGFFKILLVSAYQTGIMLFIFFIVFYVYEVIRFKKIYQDVRVTGSDYLEQVKDYFFYNSEVYNCILVDLEPYFAKMKDSCKFQENLEKGKISTQELFEVYNIIHKEFSKHESYVKKLVKSDFLESVKKIRLKELEDIKKAEEDAKELKKYFAKQSYSEKK